MAGKESVFGVAFAVGVIFTVGWVAGVVQIHDCTLFVECRNPAGDAGSSWWLPTLLSLVVSGCGWALVLAWTGMRLVEMVSPVASDAGGE